MMQPNFGVTAAKLHCAAQERREHSWSVQVFPMPVFQEIAIEVPVTLHFDGADTPGQVAQHQLVADRMEC
jgi:hypothetical protein